MTYNISMSKNMIIVSVAILIIMAKKSIMQERFSQEEIIGSKSVMKSAEMKSAETKSEVEPRIPYVNPETGTLMDGPGFERPLPDDAAAERSSVIPSNYYFLDDGANGEFSVQHNMCSKSCCSEQWPTPFKQKYDPYVCNNKDKFVPSNIFCNNSFQDSGCLCLSKKQASFMYNRGGNGREWF